MATAEGELSAGQCPRLPGYKRLSVVAVMSNNNKWQWCLRMVAADLSTDLAQIGLFGLRVGGHRTLSLHSSNEPGELSQ